MTGTTDAQINDLALRVDLAISRMSLTARRALVSSLTQVDFDLVIDGQSLAVVVASHYGLYRHWLE